MTDITAADLDLYGQCDLDNHTGVLGITAVVLCDRTHDQFHFAIVGPDGRNASVPVSLDDLQRIGVMCTAVAKTPIPVETSTDPQED